MMMMIFVGLLVGDLALGQRTNMAMETFYHYTSSANAEKIMSSREIWKSMPDGDAICGSGVYLTQIPPSAGKRRIAENNYGLLAKKMMDSGRPKSCSISNLWGVT